MFFLLFVIGSIIAVGVGVGVAYQNHKASLRGRWEREVEAERHIEAELKAGLVEAGDAGKNAILLRIRKVGIAPTGSGITNAHLR